MITNVDPLLRSRYLSQDRVLGDETLSIQRATIILAPLILMALESILRDQLAALIGSQDITASWTSVAVYWLARTALFAGFIWLAWRLIPQGHSVLSSGAKQATPPVSRDPLLGLRGLAFLLVFLGHWFFVVFPPSDVADHATAMRGLWILTGSPWGGVWIFFALSGYLMGKGFVAGRYRPDRQGIGNYFRSRALRILPLYFVSVGIVTVLLRPHFLVIDSPPQAFNLLAAVMFDDRGVNPIGALWSVSTEVQFYLLVPFLYVLLKRLLTTYRRIAAAALVISAVSLSYKYYVLSKFGVSADIWQAYVFMPLFANIDIFLIGILTAFAVQNAKSAAFNIRYGIPFGIILSVLLYLGLAYWTYTGAMDGSRTQGSVVIFLGCAPITIALLTAGIIFVFETADRTKKSSSKIASIAWATSTNLGLWTYALYVWHAPIITAMRGTAAANIDLSISLRYFCLTAPLVFIIAIAARARLSFGISEPLVFCRLPAIRRGGSRNCDARLVDTDRFSLGWCVGFLRAIRLSYGQGLPSSADTRDANS